MLGDLEVRWVVVGHRDRSAMFGGECVEAVLSVSGRKLLVVDPSEVDDEAGRDVTQILTPLCACLCGCLCGWRAAAGRAARAVAAIGQEVL